MGLGLTSGLVAYYEFEGDVTDSHSTKNGVAQGTTYTKLGQIGSGTDGGYVEIADHADFDWPGAFGISAWFQAKESTANVVVAHNDTDSNTPDAWFVDYTPSSNNLRFYTSGEVLSTTAVDMDSGTGWHHIGITRDQSNDMQLWINNAVYDTAAASGNFTNTSQIEVNSRSDGEVNGRARVDELGFWKGVHLTSGAIGSLYGGGAGFAYPLGSAAILGSTYYPLHVFVSPAGAGSIIPSGLTYQSGTVAISGIANPDYAFDKWIGSLTGDTNPTTFIITGSFDISGIFNQYFNLTTYAGLGGSVTGAGSYISGTTAQVTGNPNFKHLFDSWSGDLTGSTNPDTLVIDTDKTVSGTFIKQTSFDPVHTFIRVV